MTTRPARPARREFAPRRPLSDSPGAVRSRRWRARQERGKAVVEVEYDDGVVGLLGPARLAGRGRGRRPERGRPRDRRDVERGGPALKFSGLMEGHPHAPLQT
jgi:hypothetical protein